MMSKDEPFVGDGCSLPRFLRIIIPQETALQVNICHQHDRAYHLGGTRLDRAIADANLLMGLLLTGMSVSLAHQYHTAVRVCGKAHWGPHGRYTDEPPVPQVDQSS